jgi:PAS domain S-box-containing protein
VDILLVGCANRRKVGAKTEELFRSVLRLVRLTEDQWRSRHQQQESHEQVLRAKQEWQGSVDVLAQLICLVDADGRVLRANRALEGFGLGTVKDVTGTGFMALLERLGVSGAIARIEDVESLAWMDGPLAADDSVAARNESGHRYREELENRARMFVSAEARNRVWQHWWGVLDRQPVTLGPLLARKDRLFKLRMKKCAGSIQTVEDGQDEAVCVAVLEDVTEREKTRSLIESYNENLQRQVEGQTRQVRRMNMALIKEITAHKRDKQALELSEKKYHSFAENTLIGIYLVERGRIGYCNSRFAAILGYSCEELMGRRLKEVFGADFSSDSPVVSSFLESANSALSGVEISALTKGGRKVWLQVHQARFADGAEEVVIGNVVDDTVRTEFELRLMDEKRRTRELSDQLLEAQEVERRRIARDLHDGVGQRLGAIRMRLDQIAEGDSTETAQPERDWFAEIGDRVKETLDEVRRVSMDLRPSVLDDLGINATLSWFVREFRAMAPHIEVQSDFEIDESGLDAVLKTQIFRITQEAFNNIVKHAGASKIRFSLKQTPSRLELMIRDNGRGLDDQSAVEYAGVGLRSMLERAELSGGDLFVCFRYQSGVSIVAVWP